MRETVYKFAIGLSIIFVADGLFMAWALLYGAGLGYTHFSYVPVFIPATLVALAISGIYVRGFARLSWTPRTLEWAFFILFVLAVAAKIILLIRRHWG